MERKQWHKGTWERVKGSKFHHVLLSRDVEWKSDAEGVGEASLTLGKRQALRVTDNSQMEQKAKMLSFIPTPSPRREQHSVLQSRALFLIQDPHGIWPKSSLQDQTVSLFTLSMSIGPTCSQLRSQGVRAGKSSTEIIFLT